MEKNPQDQNLADAPDDGNKIFNPSNTLSEDSDKEPVGPMGAPTKSEAQASKPTDPNPTGQANQPAKENKKDDVPEGGKSFSETTDPEKLSDL